VELLRGAAQESIAFATAGTALGDGRPQRLGGGAG
jgi:hypothetical protein